MLPRVTWIELGFVLRAANLPPEQHSIASGWVSPGCEGCLCARPGGKVSQPKDRIGELDQGFQVEWAIVAYRGLDRLDDRETVVVIEPLLSLGDAGLRLVEAVPDDGDPLREAVLPEPECVVEHTAVLEARREHLRGDEIVRLAIVANRLQPLDLDPPLVCVRVERLSCGEDVIRCGASAVLFGEDRVRYLALVTHKFVGVQQSPRRIDRMYGCDLADGNETRAVGGACASVVLRCGRVGVDRLDGLGVALKNQLQFHDWSVPLLCPGRKRKMSPCR